MRKTKMILVLIAILFLVGAKPSLAEHPDILRDGNHPPSDIVDHHDFPSDAVHHFDGYLKRLYQIAQRIDQHPTQVGKRLRRALHKIGSDPGKRAELVARATAWLDRIEARFTEVVAKVQAKINTIEDPDKKARAQEALDATVGRVTGRITEVRNRIGEVGAESTTVVAELSDRHRDHDRDHRRRDDVTITDSDIDTTPDAIDIASFEYALKAIERLEQMVEGVNEKAEATIERIKESNLSEAEKARLIGKVETTRDVAVARLQNVKERLSHVGTDTPGSPSGDDHDADKSEEDSSKQSNARKEAAMQLIEEKKETEQQTSLVPGTGGKPLAEKFDHREGDRSRRK